MNSQIDAALKGIRQEAGNSFYNVNDGFATYLINRYRLKNATPAMVVVCPTHRDMEDTASELAFYHDGSKIRQFPSWEVLPYDDLSPEKSTVCQRLNTLTDISDIKGLIVVTTVQAYYSRLIPPSAINRYHTTVQSDATLPPADLANKLIELGYSRVDKVEEHGEFSQRGYIMDIFPGGNDYPIRIDFFDDAVERLRFFDPETQRSLSDIDTITVFAVNEVLPDTAEKERAIEYLKVHKKDIDAAYYNERFQKISSGLPFNGIESILPLYCQSTAYLNDYFPEKPVVVFKNANRCRQVHQEIYDEIVEELELALKQKKITFPLDGCFFAPKSGKFPPELQQVVNLFTEYPETHGTRHAFETCNNSLIQMKFTGVDSGQLSPAVKILNGLTAIVEQGGRVVITAENEKRVELLMSYFNDVPMQVPVIDLPFLENPDFFNHTPPVVVIKGNLGRGFQMLSGQKVLFCLISVDEIYAQNTIRTSKKKSYRQVIRELEKINVNDYVVHENYGIGIYRGLKKIDVDGKEDDFMVVEFKNEDKIYVPVDNADVLSHWSGVTGRAPVLNGLGDKSWQKTKARVSGKVQDMAEELISLYAKRKMAQGTAFDREYPLLDEFQMRFTFQETEDQLQAIDDIYQDMKQPIPMDRLVCGDVGFGKTEVAMRAACMAVLHGFQVAVLVPTTVLATQHYKTFSERFSFMPVNIGVLSRMESASDIKNTLALAAEGKLDILIGTHRILSKDVVIKKLGLLIVDEEQRFGVKDKEKIRQLRVNVDTMTLTATPIPRTLHMSLMGLRDISIINSPPAERRSIKTRVSKFNTHIISEAIEREIRRNGQVFIIHNRVEDIEQFRTKLLQIIPHIEIRIAHGQMTGNRLEDVMIDFLSKKFPVLLATTIVESGLDIPNANTIIIHNADKFGLAQLYQLRGRVGRAKRQAYAYFMVKDEDRLSETALKRLNVIREMTDLGSGFKISSYDLEIRGAGNMLGAEQSGDIDGIGINLYIAMIEEAVEKIRNETVHTQKSDVTIHTDFPVGIPEDYIESMQLRLELYREIAECKSPEDTDMLIQNIADRFGAPPQKVTNLVHLSVVKQIASNTHVTELKIDRNRTVMQFNEHYQPEPMNLMNYISTQQGRIRPDNSLEFNRTFISIPEVIPLLSDLKNLN